MGCDMMNIIKNFIPYVIIALVVILTRTFILTPVVVSGSSMSDTLSDGELLLLKKYDKTYERFDIIVFDYGDTKLVKRIIGLPGETVEYKNGILYINGEKVEDPFAQFTNDFKLSELNLEEIPENTYFVLGDNRRNSSDSRIIGPIDKSAINGTTTFSLWPFGSIE